jgi:protein phosphatase inhibitor 2
MMCAVQLSVMDLNASSSTAAFRGRLDAPFVVARRWCYANVVVARMDDVRGAIAAPRCFVTRLIVSSLIAAAPGGGRQRARDDGWTTTRDATRVTMTSLDNLPMGDPMDEDDERSRRRAQRQCRRVEWDEQNLAKNFAERSATMTIDEVETPWHSPPRELFHDDDIDDARARDIEDEAVRAREESHARVMAKLESLIKADVRGSTVDDIAGDAVGVVQFHDADARDEDLDDHEEVLKRRLFDAKRKAFQCKGRGTKRFETDEDVTA